MMKFVGMSLALGALALSGCSSPETRAYAAGVTTTADDGPGDGGSGGPAGCAGLPTAAQLHTLLIQARSLSTPPIGGRVGGIFDGVRMWAAVVDRDGVLCAAATSMTDPAQVWPGSQAIAKAKAYTANSFSVDPLPLSTAELYTFAQPGHSLYGINQSNPFDPMYLAPPSGAGGGKGRITGGIITFGGGVPLYQNGSVVGGLGASGDTACADHEMAKRVRHLAGFDPPAGPTQDDISYSAIDGPSVYTHPLCPNTWRNGHFVGNEQPSTGY